MTASGYDRQAAVDEMRRFLATGGRTSTATPRCEVLERHRCWREAPAAVTGRLRR